MSSLCLLGARFVSKKHGFTLRTNVKGRARRHGALGVYRRWSQWLRRCSSAARCATSSGNHHTVRLHHLQVGGGGRLLRGAALLARAQVGRVPVPPLVGGRGLLERVVMEGRLVQEVGQRGDVRLVHPSGQAVRDLLKQPFVAVGVAEGGVRAVGLSLRVRASTRPRPPSLNALPWKISDTLTPRSISSARAASRSSTARRSLSDDPGTAGLTPVPKMIDAGEPGGVNCRTRRSSLP